MSGLDPNSQNQPNPPQRDADGRQPQRGVAIDEQIAGSLQRLYRPPAMPAALKDRLASTNVKPVKRSPGSSSGRRRPVIMALLVLAAVFIGIAARLWIEAMPVRDPAGDGPLTTIGPPPPPKPLVDVYQETVDAGFEPGWLCDDDEEFAFTFSYRHGQPLMLRPLPEGSRMLGLAYYGGISSLTTSLLCLVNSQPVMVFVDNQARDEDASLVQPTDALNVFTRSLNDLVFYEVTPFAEPRVMGLLVPPEGTL